MQKETSQSANERKDSEYKCWNDALEVTGETVLALLAAMKNIGNEDRGIQYLLKNKIKEPQAGKWYPLKNYLAALQGLYDDLGSNTLYMIGIQIPSNSIFPPEMNTFEDAMNMLDAAYQANHRGGYIGYFKFTKLGEKSATMECKQTYGTHIDRGVLTGLSRKFKPENSRGLSIDLDLTKPDRQNGDDSHTFLLTW